MSGLLLIAGNKKPGGGALSYPSAYDSAVLADSPVAYWPLDDASGTAAVDRISAANLTHTGGYTLGVAGMVTLDTGTATTYNGSTGRSTRSTTPVTAVDNWTIECWLKSAHTAASVGWAVNNGTWDAFNGYGIGVHGTTGKLWVGLFGWDNYETNQTLTDGVAYHIAARRVSGTLECYLNGVKTGWTYPASGEPTGAPPTPTRVCVGDNGYAGANAAFAGTIQKVAFYNAAISAVRILAHYNAGD